MSGSRIRRIVRKKRDETEGIVVPTTTIQLRAVPQSIHRRLKARAVLAGMSTSEHILAELHKSLARPTREEWLERLRQLPPIELPRPAAEILREEWEGR